MIASKKNFQKKDLLDMLRHRDDPAVRDKLIVQLSGLVPAMAFRHFKFIRDPDIREDLIAAGMLGLIDGVDRFDEKKSDAIVPYLVLAILRKMRRSLDHQKVVCFGIGLHERVRAVRDALRDPDLFPLGFNTPPKEVGKHFGINRSTARHYVDWVRGGGQSVKVEKENDNGAQYERIELAIAPDQRSLMADSEIRDIIFKYAKGIASKRNRTIFLDHFGLVVPDSRETLAHWGQQFGISRQRAAQIKDREVAKFKRYAEAKGF